MVDLKHEILSGASALRTARTELQARSSSSPLPVDISIAWGKRAAFYQVLDRTSDLLPVREAAWTNLNSILDAYTKRAQTFSDRDPPTLILYNGHKMDFQVARHLALTSYMTTCWSIYDRLSNVCGRVGGLAKLGERANENPKLCEDFLGKDELVGFGAHKVIKAAYAWPTKVSYKVRNWLVHEGYAEGEVPLFRDATSFVLHRDAVQLIQKCCGFSADSNGQLEACLLSPSDDPWRLAEPDLLDVLFRYNREIDAMLAAFVKWCVESFVCQVRAFCAR